MVQTADIGSKRPHIIGLTGSIGMGKSTVAAMFADAGVPVFDADAEVHRLQRTDADIIAAIEAAFPGTTNDAGVDRIALSKAVLGDKDAIKRLEAIIHPAVALSRVEFMARYKDEPLILFDIPLLFEKGGADNVDCIVTVSAPADVQRERVLARPGMSVEKFAQILGLQMPDAQKRALSDYNIDTGQPLAATQRDVQDLVAKLHRQALASEQE
jgi:dephospho-CoA kinase